MAAQVARGQDVVSELWTHVVLEEVIHEPLKRGSHSPDDLSCLEAVEVLRAATEEALHTAQEVDGIEACLGADVALVVGNESLSQGLSDLLLVHFFNVLPALEHVGADFDAAVGQVFVEYVAAFRCESAGALKAGNSSDDAVNEGEGRIIEGEFFGVLFRCQGCVGEEVFEAGGFALSERVRRVLDQKTGVIGTYKAALIFGFLASLFLLFLLLGRRKIMEDLAVVFLFLWVIAFFCVC